MGVGVNWQMECWGRGLYGSVYPLFLSVRVSLFFLLFTINGGYLGLLIPSQFLWGTGLHSHCFTT